MDAMDWKLFGTSIDLFFSRGWMPWWCPPTTKGCRDGVLPTNQGCRDGVLPQLRDKGMPWGVSRKIYSNIQFIPETSATQVGLPYWSGSLWKPSVAPIWQPEMSLIGILTRGYPEINYGLGSSACKHVHCTYIAVWTYLHFGSHWKNNIMLTGASWCAHAFMLL